MLDFYIASPYSHPDPLIVERRVREVSDFTIHLMGRGFVVFSPIVYGHTLAARYGVRGDAEFWERFNQTMMGVCLGVSVLMVDGWQDSVGIRKEIQWAKDMGRLVYYYIQTGEHEYRQVD